MGSLVFSKKNISFLSLSIDFSLANSADTDEMTLFVTFHQGICCLPMFPADKGVTYNARDS